MADLGKVLAVARTYHDLIQSLRARICELDVPYTIIEEIAGIAPGNLSHILAQRAMKHLGPVSWNLFEAVGLRIVIVADEAALARAKRRLCWRKRKQSFELPHHDYPPAA